MEGQAFIPDFTVFINSGGQLVFVHPQQPNLSSYICVEKHDAETGKIIPAAGVGFQIKDLSTGDYLPDRLLPFARHHHHLFHCG
jgi:hypothetical protein